MLKIDGGYTAPFQSNPVSIPPVQELPPPPVATVVTAKQLDAQNIGANNKAKLEKQYAATVTTPGTALDKINDLPKPDPNDTAAVKAYKEQRRQIADDAVTNSKPPKIEDYRNSGLNGATAHYEYQQSKSYYDSQIRDLKQISAEAVKNPAKIISPAEANREIENLPRPDRSDPQAIQKYNNDRAEIADDALLYAAPPNAQDYKGDTVRYNSDRKAYDEAAAKLKENSAAKYSTLPPPINDAEADKAADDYIKNHSGVENEDDGYAVGKDVAELAKKDPAAAAVIMRKVQEKLNSTDYGDNVASGFVDNSADSDLQNVGKASGGVELFRDLQHRLTTGSVHDDERDQAYKLTQALDKNGIFRGGDDGIRFNAIEPKSSQDLNAAPEEVASYVKNYPSSSYQRDVGRYEFLDAVTFHKDDADWLAKFYSALGPKQSAQLISETLNPNTQSPAGGGGSGSPELAAKQVQNILHSLETMQKGGKLTEEGLKGLLDNLPKNDQVNAYLASEVFAKSSSPELKEMFVKAAINNGNPTLEAGASQVLTTMPQTDQQRILGGLSDDQLGSLMQGAMTGQKQIYSFSDAVKFGINLNAVADMLTKVDFGGVPTLLSNAGNFSKDLQIRLFTATSKALNDSTAFDNMRDNKVFKDALSNLFINNGPDILKSQAPDGAFTDSSFISGITKFFEMALFTENGGDTRDELMQSVIKTMSNVGDASMSPPLAPAEYEKLHNGWSQQDHVEVMGGLQAMILQAASNQKDYITNEILDDQAAKQEMVSFVTGMAFSFLPGAGEVFGKIAGEGASFLKQIPDKIIDYTFEQGKSQIESASQEGLVNLLSGLNNGNSDALNNIDGFINGFKQTIVATSSVLPNGETGENGAADELNLRTAFQSAFAFYGDLVRF